jgi:hypothetical protein
LRDSNGADQRLANDGMGCEFAEAIVTECGSDNLTNDRAIEAGREIGIINGRAIEAGREIGIINGRAIEAGRENRYGRAMEAGRENRYGRAMEAGRENRYGRAMEAGRENRYGRGRAHRRAQRSAPPAPAVVLVQLARPGKIVESRS